MLPFSPTVADQIRYLLQSCNDSNFDSVLSQLCEFAEYGSEGNTLLLQTCLDQIDFHGMSTNVPVKPDIVSSVLRYLMERPHFSTIFCEATRKASSDDTFLNNLSKALNLSIFEKFGVSLALADSENLDHRVRGQSFCLSLIEELCENSTSSFSHELIRDVVMFLYRSEGLSKHVDSFTKILSLLDTKESLPFLLSPIVSGDLREVDSTRHLYLFEEGSESDFDLILSEIEKEISMADVMGELGYGCTVDISRCIDMLSLFLPLTEVTIAKLLGTIIRTRVGHEDNLNLYSTFSTAFGCNVTSDASPTTWNINVLVDSIRKLAPATNWMHVFENLDHESFYIPDSESFSFFMSLYSYACQNPFPLYTICGCVWQNAEGQLSFLRHAVSAPPEVFTFAHSERKLTHIDPIYDPSGHGNQAWHSLELLDVLCELAERGHAVAVREMLKYPIKECPELLLLGIIHSQTAYNLLQYEVFTTMFPDVLKKSKSGLVNHLWHANSSLVLHGFLHAYSMDTESIVRILSISEELKILSCILDSAPVSFSIRLAAIASQKELIDLEKWLNENVREHKDAFFEVALQFLKDNLANAKTNVPRDTSDTSEGSNISQDSCQKVLKVFQAHLGQIASPQLSEEVRKFYSSLLDPGRQSAGAIEMSAEGNTDDVETEANTYFHQMFSGQLSIDMMIQTLGRFKEYPDDKREKRIFDCMIGNLFEEYKFFPKYPDRQLKIAAILFGSLIKNQLVTHLTLGIALRCVLDALRKSVDSKMFLFGAKALEQFRERLVEWPQYCNHILQISHLRNTHSELVLFIERALARISSSQSDSNGASAINIEHPQSSSPASIENIETLHPGIQYSSSFQQQQRNQDLVGDRVKSAPVVNNVKPTLSSSVLAPHGDSANNQKTTTAQSLQATQPPTGVSTAASSSPGFARPRVTAPSGVLRQSYSTGFGAALNIETLVAAAERRDTPIEAPASETQDKIHFIINNISAANVDTKSKEFLDILKEEYYPWFAEYMVMKRASIEPNFHDLYLKFLEKISSRTLNKEIVKATYENCKVLLRSDLIKSSSEERSLLKNLGSWLGKFTIGRNQALRAREIDPKVLIMEAYERGLMIAVIPFTSKILEPCQCSLAYQPPNPWTMAILGLLVEIYNLPNLKMNLKFDIEVLFKNLGVDMKDVKPTSLLKDRTREIEGNPDFSNKDISSSQTQVIAESNSALISPLNQFEIQTQVTNASHPGGHPSGLSQYTGPLHMSLSMIEDDDKSGSLSISERGLSGLGQSQVTPSASSFTINQPLTPISNISSHIVINTKLSALGLQMHLQRIIPLAMERAVAEIISAVVTRSVTISLQTTKELVQKDYSMETDENRIRNAAKLMVSSLAGSLAHVTCKEPLRMSLSTHLRNLLQTLNVSNDLLEQTIQIITNDNLDLGCALVEQSATEKALQNIEVDIGPFIAYKKKQRESSGSYYDAAAYAQGTFARVPESLRPKPGHLSNNQQRVYEEFVKYPWHNQSSQNQSVNPTSGQLSSSGVSLNSTLARGYGSGSGQLHPGIYTMSSAAPGLVGVPQSSDLVSDVIDPGSMQILSVPPTLTAADDVSANQAAETISVVPSYSPASQELLITDSFPAIKELGAVVPPPTAATERTGASVTETSTVEDVLDKYHVLAQKLENLILLKDLTESDVQNLIQEAAMELHEALLMCTSRDEAALSVSQKIFKRLYENASNSLQVGAHLQLLGAVRDVCPLVVKEITNWVVFSDEEWKFNKDITIGLIQMELLNLADYDVHLAKLIDGGRNRVALEFVISLLPTLLNQEPGFSISEFYNLMDVLTKLAQRPGSPESLHQLIDMAKHSISNVISLPGTNVSREERHRQIRDKRGTFARQAPNMNECIGSDSLGADPAGLREVHEEASLSFAEWFRICESPTSDAAATHFISQLQQRVFLKGDEFTERFFRVVTELSVLHCLASEQVTHSQQAPVLSFVAVDILAKLVVQILKYSVDQSSSKIALLPKILSVVARAMQKDAEEKKTSFNSRPYFRLFFDLLMDLPSPDSIVDGWNFQVLTFLANCLHALQPAKVPGFSFAWLELVSHRSFMPKLLMVNGQKGWPFFQRLLVDMLKFIEPYVRSANLGEPVLFLYKGTLRMLLVLLHDFPEFLCDYHFSLCDVIPSSCIQMRNIILSAFPVNMRLPDPCTPNLKIDLLPEITQSPRILSDIDGALKSKQIKADLDEYLKIKNHGSFLTDLKQRLLLPSHEVLLAGTHYNIPLINSLVLYVGMQAIQQLQNNVSSQHVPTQGAQSGPLDIFLVGAAMDVFNHLMQDLDAEGRYIFLNAVANQLRYPNNHTHYFSFVLLYLFVEAKEEIIQEQITRVLLERLIVNRPHPWGLLITFIELIKNPRYDFWSKQFIHCAPEIENLFDQVSRSCGGGSRGVVDDLVSVNLSSGVH